MAVSHTRPVTATVISSSGFGGPVSDRIIDTGTLASRPASAVDGARYVATDTDQEFGWNGSAWIGLSEPWQTCAPRLAFGTAAYCYTTNNSASECHYKRANGICTVRYNLTISSLNGGWTNELLALINLPVAAVGMIIGTCYYYRLGVAEYAGVATTFAIGAEISGTGLNTTNGAVAFRCPSALSFSPAAGQVVSGEITYRVAS